MKMTRRLAAAAALVAAVRASAAPSYETYEKLYGRLMNGESAASTPER